MVSWPLTRRTSPIGVDVGSRSVKLVQLSADGTQLIEAARWDLTPTKEGDEAGRRAQFSQALLQAREGRRFHGRDAVVCLSQRELFVQNLRVPKTAESELEQVVRDEAAERLGFPVDEAEIRYLDAADVRQGDQVRREVIALACHRPVLGDLLQTVEDAGLRPVAVDVEPIALLRCYASQFRRDDDREQRAIFVRVGTTNSAVVIAQGGDALFIKYIDLGGRHFDEAVARYLQMPLDDAWALRRHNGDRRADQQDPDVSRGINEACRPVVDRLVHELSLCIRYHSVTFRGQPLARLVLGGGEASQALADILTARLNLKSEVGDPLRSYEGAKAPGRKSQWDVAAGLALREVK